MNATCGWLAPVPAGDHAAYEDFIKKALEPGKGLAAEELWVSAVRYVLRGGMHDRPGAGRAKRPH